MKAALIILAILSACALGLALPPLLEAAAQAQPWVTWAVAGGLSVVAGVAVWGYRAFKPRNRPGGPSLGGVGQDYQSAPRGPQRRRRFL